MFVSITTLYSPHSTSLASSKLKTESHIPDSGLDKVTSVAQRNGPTKLRQLGAVAATGRTINMREFKQESSET